MEYRIEKQSRGTRILFGDEVKERQIILNKMISIVETYGFQGIILPSIEPQELYVDKAGSEVLNQMYVFDDKKGRKLCLRPEATATVQQIAKHFWQAKKEVRVWYFEKCWRYERPQKGKVVAAGKGTKDEPITVKVGDDVMYGKFAGTEVKLDGKDYLIMRESDILAII